MKKYLLIFCLLLLSMSPALAGLDIVSVDDAGQITFNPGEIVVQLITVVVGSLVAGAALVVLWYSVMDLYRWLQDRRNPILSYNADGSAYRQSDFDQQWAELQARPDPNDPTDSRNFESVMAEREYWDNLTENDPNL